VVASLVRGYFLSQILDKIYQYSFQMLKKIYTKSISFNACVFVGVRKREREQNKRKSDSYTNKHILTDKNKKETPKW